MQQSPFEDGNWLWVVLKDNKFIIDSSNNCGYDTSPATVFPSMTIVSAVSDWYFALIYDRE